MISPAPTHFYKYRKIDDGDLGKDRTLKALLDYRAWFSGRKAFNDLFDSKIELIQPTPKDIKLLSSQLPKAKGKELRQFIDKGKFSPFGKEWLENALVKFNEVIDNYTFYCVSARADSNLMWSHYSDSHRGFCIEFKAKKFPANKVTYQKTIPQIQLLDFLKCNFDDTSGEALGKLIWDALRTKLDEWSYEEEYRFQPGGSVRTSSLSYEPDWIESIIFGCRMPKESEEYIVKNLPSGTKFKRAVERSSTLGIIPC